MRTFHSVMLFMILSHNRCGNVINSAFISHCKRLFSHGIYDIKKIPSQKRCSEVSRTSAWHSKQMGGWSFRLFSISQMTSSGSREEVCSWWIRLLYRKYQLCALSHPFYINCWGDWTDRTVTLSAQSTQKRLKRRSRRLMRELLFFFYWTKTFSHLTFDLSNFQIFHCIRKQRKFEGVACEGISESTIFTQLMHSVGGS